MTLGPELEPPIPPPPLQTNTLPPFSNKLTSVGDCKPSSQEVEGPVRGVSDIARQRLKVALSRQPAHELGGIRAEFSVVQSVWAVGKGVQQGPIGHGELSRSIVAGAQGALVTGGGGGEIRLDGEQMGILCLNNKRRKALAWTFRERQLAWLLHQRQTSHSLKLLQHTHQRQ